MLFSYAKHEFEIRRYYWSISEFEKEIANSFPNLCLFKSGFGWQINHFMQQLELSDRLTLAHAIVKRWHSTEMKDLGEVITDEEKRLLESFDQLTSKPTSLDAEIQSRKQAGAKIRFASKRNLRKALVAKFIEAFGPQCVEMKISEEWDPLFQMKYCGWIVSTQLSFGHRQGLASYRHIIASETRIQHPQNPKITGPAMTLVPGVAWLVNRWEDLMDSDVESAGNAVIKHCRFFFEAAPKLLKGLEFDKIEPLSSIPTPIAINRI
jgi:hypothetical protein